MSKNRFAVVMFMLSLLAACSDSAQDPGPDVTGFDSSDFFFPAQGIDADAVSVGQLIYVPVYSRVHLSGLGVRELAVSLSIRNTDLEQPIFIQSVQYYNTEGKLLENYITTTHQLAPLATAEFVIDQADKRGGSGANFLVEWVAGRKVNVPVVEAVMAGITGSQGLSFIRNGHVIKQLGESP